MYSQLNIESDSIKVTTGDKDFQPSTVNINGRCYFRDFKNNKKQSLFTTYDNVDLFDKDGRVFIVNESFNISGLLAVHVNSVSSHFPSYKIFSTKDAAKEFIIMNKPCLSLKEIGVAIENNNEHIFNGTETFLELKKLSTLKNGNADC